MNTAFAFILDALRRMKPGEWFCISKSVLCEIRPIPMVGLPGPLWYAEDQVLEKIAGSAYEYFYTNDTLQDFEGFQSTFYRLKSPLPASDGRRTYVSPDRRHYYTKQGCFYVPLPKEKVVQPGETIPFFKT